MHGQAQADPAVRAPRVGRTVRDGAPDDARLGRIIATDGLFVVDERQRIVHWSETAQRLLGFSADEVLGRPCYLALMGREPSGHPVCGRDCRVIANARRGRGTATYEVVAADRSGAARCVSISVVLLEGLRRGTFRALHLFREVARGPLPRRAVSAPPPVRPTVERLTRRELEVLRIFATGSTPAEIAHALHISPFTARNHVASVQRKLGARNRLEIVLLSMRAGLL